MESRQSSQSAMGDHFRADLAEIWSAYEMEPLDSTRAPSVSAVSNMLDEEYIPTPGHHLEKEQHNDLLADLLGDVVETSPTQTRGRFGRPVVQAKSGDNASTLKDETISSRFRERIPGQHKDSVSPSVEQQDLANGNGPRNSTSTAKKRKRQNEPSEAAGATEATTPPAPRRKPQMKNKGPAKTQGRAKSSVEKPTNLGGRRRKRNDDESAFELSNHTDQDEVKPKSNQQQQPSPKNLAQSKSNGHVNDSDVPHPGPRPKQSRVPKKPRLDIVMQPESVEVVDKHSLYPSNLAPEEPVATAGHASTRDENMSDAASNIHVQPENQGKTTSQRLETPEVFPDPHTRLSEPVLPHESFTSAHPVAVSPPQAPDTSVQLVERSSPMFVDRNEDSLVPSSVPDIEIQTKVHTPDKQPSLRSQRDLRCTTPPFCQPGLTIGAPGPSQQHRTGGYQPEYIQDPFFPTQPPRTAVSKSLSQKQQACPEDGGLNPEDVWKDAVEDDDPPAVLLRFAKLLHRSLKDKTDVIRDIVADYRENSTKLIENLVLRHAHERTIVSTALRRASQILFSAFSSAKHDLAVFVGNMKGMDIAYAADQLMRPALTQRLDGIAKATRARLHDHDITHSVGDEGPGVNGSGVLNDLEKSYQLRLMKSLQGPDDQSVIGDTLEKLNPEVEQFIQECLHGQIKTVPIKTAEESPKRSSKRVRNPDDALEVLLDGIIGSLNGAGENDSRRADQDA